MEIRTGLIERAERRVIDLEGLPHQVELWQETRSREVALIGPLGCGKTYSLAVKQALLRMLNVGTDGMLVIPTLPLARQIHKPEWPAIWERVFGIRVPWRESDFAWVWPWGSKTWVRSADEPEKLVGSNLGDATFDEPALMDELAYKKGSSRVRHPAATVRQVVFGGTPEGLNWVSEKFDNASREPGADTRVIYASEWHPDLAHYPKELKKLYADDEQQLASYAHGRFVPLRVGRVYHGFERSRNMADFGYIPAASLIIACDFNVANMRWVVLQHFDKMIRVLEVLYQGSTTEKLAKMVVERWADRHKGKVLVVGDRSGKARSTSSSKTDYQVILEQLTKAWPGNVQFRIPSSNPLVVDRVKNLNVHLIGESQQAHQVMIARNGHGVQELVKDFEQVQWASTLGAAREDQSRDPRRTHAAAALGYYAWVAARAIRTGGRILARRESLGMHPAAQRW